ncbi:MAG: glycosyltransferase family 4 protein, partial [Acinetobacter sp.]|nr:glycosyltransferase family 4 protein [Acinetobacter sp.]
YTFTEQPEGFAKKTKIIRAIQVMLYKLALPLLDRLIFLNPDDPKDLLEKHHIQVKNVSILGGIGLNLADYPYSPLEHIQQPIQFLFIGRLLKEKGIHEFIAAAKIVKQRYDNVQFTVLGAIDTANLGALLQQDLDHYIQSGLIHYPGQVPNVKDYIAQSHVFVLPSYREGVPRSSQEAAAMGRAIITNDVAGCRETVENGVNGFLVERWNAQVLADKMIYFIENPQQIIAMGQASHQLAVEKFDADKVNQRLIEMMGIGNGD